VSPHEWGLTQSGRIAQTSPRRMTHYFPLVRSACCFGHDSVLQSEFASESLPEVLVTSRAAMCKPSVCFVTSSASKLTTHVNVGDLET
jgi:hypothetical protein